jgi:hypothetical protein
MRGKRGREAITFVVAERGTGFQLYFLLGSDVYFAKTAGWRCVGL